jgi:hypothetical protein
MDEFMGKWQSGELNGNGLSYNPGKNTYDINNLSFPITNISYHNAQVNPEFPQWHNDAASLAK